MRGCFSGLTTEEHEKGLGDCAEYEPDVTPAASVVVVERVGCPGHVAAIVVITVLLVVVLVLVGLRQYGCALCCVGGSNKHNQWSNDLEGERRGEGGSAAHINPMYAAPPGGGVAATNRAPVMTLSEGVSDFTI